MITKRNFTSFLFIASLGVAAGAATLTTSPANAGGSCSKKGQGSEFGEVKKACGKGLTDAKKMMKAIEKAAKKKGEGEGHDWKCDDCHKDKKEFALKDGAVDKYKKWRKFGGY